MEPINKNWYDADENHQGGVSTGIGYTISWQRGTLNVEGRNGAFLIEVLESCKHQIDSFNTGKFACKENNSASVHLFDCIEALKERSNRRKSQGTLGTHTPEETK